MTQLCDFGLVGLAVMGENLALNIESRGYRIAVFNRTTSVVDHLIEGRAKGKKFVGCHSLEDLVKAVAAPRKIMLMVKAGPAVDALIDQLIPLLSPGDIIIDGGNTHYLDTERRTAYVESKGLLLHRHRRFRRRRGCLDRAQHHAGGQRKSLARGEADLASHFGKGRPEARHPLLRMGRSARRWPLRQDGAQRHRIRRHAIDLRSLFRAQAGAEV